MRANGKLGAPLDTAVKPDGGPTRAGIAWFIVNPNAGEIVDLSATSTSTGYDLTYPAIGVTSSGRSVMAFTATGTSTYPSAAADAAIYAKGGLQRVEHRPQVGKALPLMTASQATRRRSATCCCTRWGDDGVEAVYG